MRGVASAGERISIPNEVIERVIALLLRAGFSISRPCTLELDPIERIDATLHKAKHKFIMAMPQEANDQIGLALLEIKRLSDYLGDLRSLGVRVPISYKQWCQQKGFESDS